MGKISTGSGESDPANIHWCTPLWATEFAAKVFSARPGVSGIELDPCPNEGSVGRVGAAHNLLLSAGHDGLKDDWHTFDGNPVRNAWVNPPFGRYYFHPITKDFLSPKDVKRLVKQEAGSSELSKEQLKALKTKILQGYETHSIAEWIHKCAKASALYDMDVMQIGPLSGSSKWWQGSVEAGAASLILRSRVKYDIVAADGTVMSQGNSAPMDCAINLWTKNLDVLKTFRELGHRHLGSVHLLEKGLELYGVKL